MNQTSLELKVIIILILFYTSILCYFIIFLAYSHFSRNYRNSQKLKIITLLKEYLQGNETIKLPKRKLFSSIGIEAASELVENLETDVRLKLNEYLMERQFDRYMLKIIKSSDKHTTAFVIKLAGNLQIAEMGGLILNTIYKNKASVDLQYIGLEALAKLAQEEKLLRVFNDDTVPIKLTYRAFENVFMVYSGPKSTFYKKILNVKDQYVVRIVIKRIGSEGLSELAPEIRRFLEAKEKDMRIAAITSLGLLKDTASFEVIKSFCNNEVWEVRSAALKSMASIDLEASAPYLMEGLKDSEWWVRYNSASQLVRCREIDKINKEVSEGNDTFAKEILNYVIEKTKF